MYETNVFRHYTIGSTGYNLEKKERETNGISPMIIT